MKAKSDRIFACRPSRHERGVEQPTVLRAKYQRRQPLPQVAPPAVVHHEYDRSATFLRISRQGIERRGRPARSHKAGWGRGAESAPPESVIVWVDPRNRHTRRRLDGLIRGIGRRSNQVHPPARLPRKGPDAGDGVRRQTGPSDGDLHRRQRVRSRVHILRTARKQSGRCTGYCAMTSSSVPHLATRPFSSR